MPPGRVEPLVSVVTPVYNGESHLTDCIESVLAQTYENWEYVIVDNCSTDATPAIAAGFAEADARIRVHTNADFLEIIPNWNNALRQISGESTYCKVVHADDLLFPDCLEKMVRVAEENPSVGIVGSFQLRGAKVDLDRVIPYPVTVVSGREICRATLTGGGFVFGTPTTILIRADVVRERDRFYNEENLHADTEACFDVLRTADFGFVHQILSYTRPHEAAMTTTAVRLNTFIVGRLIVLPKYGPYYLGDGEYERRLARQVARYGVFLAKAVVRRKVADRRFRMLHRQAVRRLRSSVTLRELGRGIGVELASALRRS